MEVNVKSTIWTTYDVPDELEAKIAAYFHNNQIVDTSDLDDFLNANSKSGISCEINYDTEQFLNPDENNGWSTIELVDNYGNVIWDNSTRPKNSSSQKQSSSNNKKLLLT